MNKEEQKKIVKECSRNSMSAKKRLYELFRDKMYMVSMRYADNKEDAQDVLQDSFMKVFNNIHKFRNEGSLEGWVKRIVATTAINHYKKKYSIYAIKSVEHVAEENEDLDFMQELAASFSMAELLNMINELSPRYRMVFNLYAIDGHSHKEIAQLLDISVGTSKSQLSRARQVLKEMITKRQKEDNHVKR